MTIKDFQELVKKNNIPQDAVIMSNSGWECGATDVDALYYSPSKNEIHLVQYFGSYAREYDEDKLKRPEEKAHDWVLIKE